VAPEDPCCGSGDHTQEAQQQHDANQYPDCDDDFFAALPVQHNYFRFIDGCAPLRGLLTP
jgi:hypothetical protein